MDIAVRIVERGCDRMQEHHWKPPTEKSQSPKGAVPRTNSSARGIHVVRLRRGRERRLRNMKGSISPL